MERSDFHFWSVAGLVETDGEERTMTGADFRWVVYWDDHAPPISGYLGGQILRGDGQTIVRATGTFSLFAFRAGPRFSFWFRPIVGLEHRSAEPDWGLGLLTSLGAEIIFRPKSTWQIALTYDRIFSTLSTNTQFGLAVRWGRMMPVVSPSESMTP